jgi:hypothetical protein
VACRSATSGQGREAAQRTLDAPRPHRRCRVRCMPTPRLAPHPDPARSSHRAAGGVTRGSPLGGRMGGRAGANIMACAQRTDSCLRPRPHENPGRRGGAADITPVAHTRRARSRRPSGGATKRALRATGPTVCSGRYVEWRSHSPRNDCPKPSGLNARWALPQLPARSAWIYSGAGTPPPLAVAPRSGVPANILTFALYRTQKRLTGFVQARPRH